MIHSRRDYDRFKEPALKDPKLLGYGATAIAEDEPVFLMRAQDELFLAMLEHYLELLQEKYGYDPPINLSVAMHYERAKEWQRKHGFKQPDIHMPSPWVLSDEEDRGQERT